MTPDLSPDLKEPQMPFWAKALDYFKTEAVTPGPWFLDGLHEAICYTNPYGKQVPLFYLSGKPHETPLADAEFILNAKTSIDTLLGVIDQLQTENAQLKGHIAFGEKAKVEMPRLQALLERYKTENAALANALSAYADEKNWRHEESHVRYFDKEKQAWFRQIIHAWSGPGKGLELAGNALSQMQRTHVVSTQPVYPLPSSQTAS